MVSGPMWELARAACTEMATGSLARRRTIGTWALQVGGGA
jgi:hypothetical protein